MRSWLRSDSTTRGCPLPTAAGRASPRGTRRAPAHLHLFRRVGDDPFSSATLYACRCGEVRSGF